MRTIFNQTIQTPIGQGIGQGPMEREDETVFLVRLPINEQTEPHRRDENCVTHNAIHSGLWFFEKGELK